MISDQELQRGARELRSRLDLSQSAFGQRIGRTLGTILRYESQVPPKGEALVPYAVLAIDTGHEDLADLFRTAILEQLSPEIERVIAWRRGGRARDSKIPSSMATLVRAFLDFMSSKDLSPSEEVLRGMLQRMLLNEFAPAGSRAKKRPD